MTRYHSAGIPFRDSLAHQESVSVRLNDGPTHTSVQFPDGVPYDDVGAVRLHNNKHLLDILREENATLKRELDAYYQRVRKLMRVSPYSLKQLIKHPSNTAGARAGEGERGPQTTG